MAEVCHHTECLKFLLLCKKVKFCFLDHTWWYQVINPLDDILHVFTSVSIVFLDRDGDKIFAKAKVGASFLDIAIDNDVELEGIFKVFL